ncbi:MAG: LacI family DNA-binding transcriptional regulator, partial [Candidatus Hydrogenedentes bacterium]|nr:LacI family DNA-binding transcriptional regulator [Candidatus Hydrogenedentota bacterium]
MARKGVTISEIATQAGVHPSTVSRALREDPLIPPATRSRIQEIANALGYRPNPMAKGLKGHATNSVGILVPRLRDDFYATLVSHQEEWLRKRNMTPILFVTKIEEALERAALDELTSRGADGVIVNYEPVDPATREVLEVLAHSGTPVAMLGGPRIPGVDSVFFDTVEMGRQITEHLIRLGHRRIAFLTWSVQRRRIQGYRRALTDFGIPLDPELVFVMDENNPDFAQAGAKLMSLEDRPTAVFGYDDNLAVELINQLLEAGHRVPEDVSVTGFDDC